MAQTAAGVEPPLEVREVPTSQRVSGDIEVQDMSSNPGIAKKPKARGGRTRGEAVVTGRR